MKYHSERSACLTPTRGYATTINHDESNRGGNCMNEELSLKGMETAIINLLLEDLIKNLRMRSEQEQDSLFDARIPNEETLKAIDETEKGIGLIECDDADNLFRKLGI